MSVASTASAQNDKPFNFLMIWGDGIGVFNISAYNRGMMGYETTNIDPLTIEHMNQTMQLSNLSLVFFIPQTHCNYILHLKCDVKLKETKGLKNMKKGKMTPYLAGHIWGNTGLFLCVATALFLMVTAYEAQAETNPSTQAAKEAAKIGENKTGFKAGSFILAPIPIQSPSIGTGLVAVGAYLFKTDKDSNTSFFGVSGFRTDNGSQGYGLAGTISWDANRWSVGVIAGVADITYDFYVPNSGGRTVSLQQDGRLINLKGKYGVTNHFFAGLEFRYLDTTVHFSSPIGTPGRDVNLETIMIGPTLEWDTRDDTIYPTTGSHVSFSSLHGFVLNGMDREYHKTVIKYDNYIPLFVRSVIATRFTACNATNSTPFFDLCSVGGTDSLRGFPFGQLLAQSLLSVQVEYRGLFNQRFGYTAFAGAGGVATNFSDFNSNSAQTAGGLGLRYRLSKKTPLDFSIDASVNSYGETTTYITIGQRF